MFTIFCKQHYVLTLFLYCEAELDTQTDPVILINRSSEQLPYFHFQEILKDIYRKGTPLRKCLHVLHCMDIFESVLDLAYHLHINRVLESAFQKSGFKKYLI